MFYVDIKQQHQKQNKRNGRKNRVFFCVYVFFMIACFMLMKMLQCGEWENSPMNYEQEKKQARSFYIILIMSYAHF